MQLAPVLAQNDGEAPQLMPALSDDELQLAFGIPNHKFQAPPLPPTRTLKVSLGQVRLKCYCILPCTILVYQYSHYH
jgi:hypothetical protein